MDWHDGEAGRRIDGYLIGLRRMTGHVFVVRLSSLVTVTEMLASVREVLEKGGHRNPGALEDPHPANAVRMPFHSRARRPVDRVRPVGPIEAARIAVLPG